MIKLKVFLLREGWLDQMCFKDPFQPKKKGFPCAAQAPAAQEGAKNEPQVN